MAAELIGPARCPVCSGDKARLSLAKSKLTVLTCNGCNLQVFARSDRSDEKLRLLLLAESAAPAKAPTPAPVQAMEPVPAVRTAPAPTPAPAQRGSGWGAFPCLT